LQTKNSTKCVCVKLVFTARRKISFASAVLATTNPSVRPYDCPSHGVTHTPVWCQNEGTQKDEVVTIG